MLNKKLSLLLLTIAPIALTTWLGLSIRLKDHKTSTEYFVLRDGSTLPVGNHLTSQNGNTTYLVGKINSVRENDGDTLLDMQTTKNRNQSFIVKSQDDSIDFVLQLQTTRELFPNYSPGNKLITFTRNPDIKTLRSLKGKTTTLLVELDISEMDGVKTANTLAKSELNRSLECNKQLVKSLIRNTNSVNNCLPRTFQIITYKRVEKKVNLKKIRPVAMNFEQAFNVLAD